MTLLELFDRVAIHRWTDRPLDTRLTANATFVVKGKRYEVDFYSYSVGVTAIEFSKVVDNGYSAGIEGTGDEIAVFGAVASTIKDYLTQCNPSAIQFTADEPSRIKLYDRMVKVLFAEWKASKTNIAPNGAVRYMLLNPAVPVRAGGFDI